MNLRDADQVLFEIDKSASFEEFEQFLNSLPAKCDIQVVKGWYFSDNPEYSTRGVPSFAVSGECFVSKIWGNDEIRNKFLSKEESFLGIFDGKAYLAFTDKNLEIDPSEDYIGKWVKISPEQAKEILNKEEPWTGLTLYPDGSYYTAINDEEEIETEPEKEPAMAGITHAVMAAISTSGQLTKLRINLLGSCKFFDITISNSGKRFKISTKKQDIYAENASVLRDKLKHLLENHIKSFDGLIKIDIDDEYELFVYS